MKVTAKKSTAKSAKVNSEESTVDLEEQIRRRAYQLYERRGCEHGHEVEDWLAAEAELAQERTMSVARTAVKKTGKPAVASSAKAKANPVKKSGSAAQSKTD